MSNLPPGEIKAQSMEDIEDGRIPKKCYICKHKQNVHIKHITTSDQKGEIAVIRTKNKMGVCTNPQCHRYSNPKNIPSWVPESKVING